MTWSDYVALSAVFIGSFGLARTYVCARQQHIEALQTLLRAKQTLLQAEDMRKEAWSIIDEYFPGASEVAQKIVRKRTVRKE